MGKPELELDGRPRATVTAEAIPAYIGLGANLGDRQATTRAALEAPPGVVARLAVRETDPVGARRPAAVPERRRSPPDELGPRELLGSCSRSSANSAAAPERWGPRTIDLDLLLFGDEANDEPGLTVPHPRLRERRFVLEPLADLDAELVDSGARAVGGPACGTTLTCVASRRA